MANAEVVAAGVSEIPAGLDDIESWRKISSAQGLDRAVRGAIIDHDDAVPGAVKAPQRLEADERIGEPVPVQHDNPYRGRTCHLDRVIARGDVCKRVGACMARTDFLGCQIQDVENTQSNAFFCSWTRRAS